MGNPFERQPKIELTIEEACQAMLDGLISDGRLRPRRKYKVEWNADRTKFTIEEIGENEPLDEEGRWDN
jgi:hypothetical protein